MRKALPYSNILNCFNVVGMEYFVKAKKSDLVFMLIFMLSFLADELRGVLIKVFIKRQLEVFNKIKGLPRWQPL